MTKDSHPAPFRLPRRRVLRLYSLVHPLYPHMTMESGSTAASAPPPVMRSATAHLPSKSDLLERIRDERSAVLLVNTRSRRGRELLDATEGLLAEEGYGVVEEFLVHDSSLLAGTIERAVALKPSLLIVGGGDGTVSRIVGHLAYCDTALGLLPVGTTNNFARNLGMPFDLGDAVRVVTRGKVVDVDLGRVGDRFFANVASIGLGAEVHRRVSPHLKRVVGPGAYGLTGVRAFLSHSPFEAVVHTSDARHHFHTHQLIVANGAFYGGRLIARGVSAEDRVLTIFALGDRRKRRLLAGLASHAYGRRRRAEGGFFISTAEARIVTCPVRDVEIDGEIKARTPVAVSVAEQALRVMAPLAFVDR